MTTQEKNQVKILAWMAIGTSLVSLTFALITFNQVNDLADQLENQVAQEIAVENDQALTALDDLLSRIRQERDSYAYANH